MICASISMNGMSVCEYLIFYFIKLNCFRNIINKKYFFVTCKIWSITCGTPVRHNVAGGAHWPVNWIYVTSSQWPRRNHLLHPNYRYIPFYRALLCPSLYFRQQFTPFFIKSRIVRLYLFNVLNSLLADEIIWALAQLKAILVCPEEYMPSLRL